MNPWWALAAALACIAGAALLYLAAPQQQWRAAGPWPARGRWWPGTLCLLLSLACMWRLLAPVEAIAAWCVLASLAWSLAPFLGAWRARARSGRS